MRAPSIVETMAETSKRLLEVNSEIEALEQRKAGLRKEAEKLEAELREAATRFVVRGGNEPPIHLPPRWRTIGHAVAREPASLRNLTLSLYSNDDPTNRKTLSAELSHMKSRGLVENDGGVYSATRALQAALGALSRGDSGGRDTISSFGALEAAKADAEGQASA